jgi:hypothetical protein
MYDDSGSGLGYEHGQSANTPISSQSGPHSSSVVIGPASGNYPSEPTSRTYTLDLVDLSRPQSVLLGERPLPASDWSYDSATHTVIVNAGPVRTDGRAVVTQIGGSPIELAEPAATQLTITPAASVVATPGATTTVSASLANSGPGAIENVGLTLNTPAGWTAAPTTPTTASSLAAGSTFTASWSVTSPAGSQPETGTMAATATYTDAANGLAESETAQEVVTPQITSVSPTTASAGEEVTINGANFGATQGDSYVTFSDSGTNWGAPGDLATFAVDSWSDNAITFTVPTPSGTGGVWQVVPGTTATVSVTTPEASSGTADVSISSG